MHYAWYIRVTRQCITGAKLHYNESACEKVVHFKPDHVSYRIPKRKFFTTYVITLQYRIQNLQKFDEF